MARKRASADATGEPVADRLAGSGRPGRADGHAHGFKAWPNAARMQDFCHVPRHGQAITLHWIRLLVKRK